MAFPTLFVAAVTMLFFLDVAGAERKVSVDVGGNIDKDDIEELYDALTIDNLNTIGVEDAPQHKDATLELQRRLREFVDRLPTENGLIKMDAKPGNAKAVAVLGLGMLRVGEPTFAGLAMEHLRQALTLSPALPNLQRAVGNELQKRARANPLDQGSFQQAFEAYTAALMRAPTDGTMYYDFGRLQTVREGKDNFGQPLAGFNISRHIGSNEDAVSKMWRTATTLSPADWRIARDLSLRLSQSRKKSLRTEAVTLAETAAQLAPHRTTVHVAVAAAHVRHALPTSLPTGRLSYANAEALGHNRKQRTAAVEALQRATSASLETRAQADAYYELGVLVHTIPPVKGREGQIALKDLKYSHLCFEAALKLNPSDANAMLELKKTTNADWTRPAPVSSGSDRTPDRGGTPYDGLTGQPVTLTPAQLASLNAAQSTADRAADAAKLSRASVAAVRAAQRSNSMLPPEEHVEHEAPEDDVDALPGWE